MPPLPHHRAYGSVPRRFGGLSANERVHGDQTETTETGIGEGAVQSFGEAQPPGSLWAKDGRTGRPFGDPEPTELTIALAARLPLDPRDATQAPPNPAVQRWQLVPLAEAKVTGPAPHERVQVGNHPLQTDAPVPPRQLTDPVFEPGHGLVGDAPPEQRVVPDREAKERPLPRSGDGTLLRVDLKLEAAFDEVGQACHDPSACLFAADIDVTVIRVPHEPVAAPLKFVIKLIQDEIREQRRKRPALRGPFPALLEQPAVEHSSGQVSPDQPENPPVRDPRRHRGHQSVVIDPIEKFGQVKIYNKPIALDYVGLRLRHRLVGRAARPEAVAVLAECRVPPRLQPLQDRLLDHAIDHGWNAKVARPAVRLRDLHPTHRLRLIAPLEQLFFDLGPARVENTRQLLDGDPVDAGRALVAHHCTQRRFYVVRVTDRLHEVRCRCRAFGFGCRRDRFDLLSLPGRGFTPTRHRQGQRQLVWRSHCGHEMSDLLAPSFNPFSGTVRAFDRHAGLLCPLLTSAPRSGCLAASSVQRDTTQISRGKLDNFPRTPAGFTVPALDGYGLCDILPARPTDTASYPVSVCRVAILLHASFRQSLAVLPLRFARLHLHQVVRGLPPPSYRTCSTHIGIGGHLAMPPLPHHRAYGSVPRRFGGLSANERVHGDQTETTETGIGEGAVQK